MKEKKQNRKLIYKSVLLIFLVISIMSMFSLIWETYIVDFSWDNATARQISICEGHLKEKEYGELWEYLVLYQLEDEEFDKYWDAVNARLEEMENEQWNKREL